MVAVVHRRRGGSKTQSAISPRARPSSRRGREPRFVPHRVTFSLPAVTNRRQPTTSTPAAYRNNDQCSTQLPSQQLSFAIAHSICVISARRRKSIHNFSSLIVTFYANKLAPPVSMASISASLHGRRPKREGRSARSKNWPG